VSAAVPSHDGGAEKRRTTRIVHAVPITIRGMDALGQAFEEYTSTVTVNCNGCKYESKHYVPKGSKLTIELRGNERGGLPPRKFPARVVWVQRPRTYREIFHVALEFEVPGNIWDIKSPPKDWFQHPDDEELIIPVSTERDVPETFALPLAASIEEELEAETFLQPSAHSSSAVATLPTVATMPEVEIAEPVIHPPPATLQQHNSELESARQMLRTIVEAALAEDITLLRQHLESQLQQSVQETVKSYADRIAEHVLKAVAERATERTAGVVAKARGKGNVAELDAKIALAAREAVSPSQKPSRKPTPAKRARKSSK
jgi:PilZ domain-containing protein